MSGDKPDNFHYKAFQPVAAFVKEWDSTFASGSEVKRTIKVFNDTRFDDPIDVFWSISYQNETDDGTPAPPNVKVLSYSNESDGLEKLAIPPGSSKEASITLKMPKVTRRTPVKFSLRCSRKGENIFSDEKIFHLIPAQTSTPQAAIHVFDPKGSVKAHLKKRVIAFTGIDSFDKIPDKLAVLIVGADALTPRQATDPRWQALAAGGAKILVLDQQNPLHFQATPADFDVTANGGHIAFLENPDHPAFAGLGSSDFFCWSGDQTVYRQAYRKATHGARSLLQCDDELSCSILAECPINNGLLLLCQAVVGSKLATDPVAQRLFDNLLNYAADYKPVSKVAVAVFNEGDLRLKLLQTSGLKFGPSGNLSDALSDSKNEIVIADASAANLARLAVNPDPLRQFTERGGQLMLWGLTEKGLPDFNQLVGVQHVIRPFKMERVTLPAKRDPFIAGLTARDVVLEGSEKINPWAGDRFPAADTFTQIVDLDDVAPFANAGKDAHAWSQMTNGLTSADSWKFIMYHNLKEQGAKPRWEGAFPKAVTVDRFSIIINGHYNKITKLKLICDDNENDAVTLDLKPEAELRQDFDIPSRACKRITLEAIAWDDAGKAPVIGIDNIWIGVKRDADYQAKVSPLLNIGGLVRYKLGKGGIVLNQLRIQASEANPINGEKKQAIVATLLRNMGASFAGEKSLIPGSNLVTTPIPLDDKCNAFLTSDKGWLNGQPDLAHFPVGNQKLAGVNYVIRDFKTSPLPSCIMLAGPGAKGNLPKSVSGIPVVAKADALFFLHTFHTAKTWKPEATRRNRRSFLNMSSNMPMARRRTYRCVMNAASATSLRMKRQASPMPPLPGRRLSRKC